ncbi:MAG: hypothetical protein ACI8QZ_002629 [Chlamydiales bacterium]|jgi:hypothetical protein
MKLVLLALALTAGCVTTPPSQLVLPRGVVRDGVCIDVTGIMGTWTRPRAFLGTVQNISGKPIQKCSLRIDAIGYQGRVVGRASAVIENLGVGERCTFRAKFPGPRPTGMHQVTIGAARAQY